MAMMTKGGGDREEVGWGLGHIREANCTCELQWLLHFLIPADERQLQVDIFGCWCSNSSSRDNCCNCSCPQRSKAMSSVSSLGCILSAVLIKNLCSLWHPSALLPPLGVSAGTASASAAAADDDVANGQWSSCLGQNTKLWNENPSRFLSYFKMKQEKHWFIDWRSKGKKVSLT